MISKIDLYFFKKSSRDNNAMDNKEREECE